MGGGSAIAGAGAGAGAVGAGAEGLLICGVAKVCWCCPGIKGRGGGTHKVIACWTPGFFLHTQNTNLT